MEKKDITPNINEVNSKELVPAKPLSLKDFWYILSIGLKIHIGKKQRIQTNEIPGYIRNIAEKLLDIGIPMKESNQKLFRTQLEFLLICSFSENVISPDLVKAFSIQLDEFLLLYTEASNIVLNRIQDAKYKAKLSGLPSTNKCIEWFLVHDRFLMNYLKVSGLKYTHVLPIIKHIFEEEEVQQDNDEESPVSTRLFSPSSLNLSFLLSFLEDIQDEMIERRIDLTQSEIYRFILQKLKQFGLSPFQLKRANDLLQKIFSNDHPMYLFHRLHKIKHFRNDRVDHRILLRMKHKIFQNHHSSQLEDDNNSDIVQEYYNWTLIFQSEVLQNPQFLETRKNSFQFDEIPGHEAIRCQIQEFFRKHPELVIQQTREKYGTSILQDQKYELIKCLQVDVGEKVKGVFIDSAPPKELQYHCLMDINVKVIICDLQTRMKRAILLPTTSFLEYQQSDNEIEGLREELFFFVDKNYPHLEIRRNDPILMSILE